MSDTITLTLTHEQADWLSDELSETCRNMVNTDLEGMPDRCAALVALYAQLNRAMGGCDEED